MERGRDYLEFEVFYSFEELQDHVCGNSRLLILYCAPTKLENVVVMSTSLAFDNAGSTDDDKL